MPKTSPDPLLVWSSPEPLCQISEQFYEQIMALQAKSKDHLTEKLAQLGVYDLQALKLAVGVLQSEAGGGNMATHG